MHVCVMLCVIVACGIHPLFADCMSDCDYNKDLCVYNSMEYCQNYMCEPQALTCLNNAQMMFEWCVQDCMFFGLPPQTCAGSCETAIFGPCYQQFAQCAGNCEMLANEACNPAYMSCIAACN